MDNSVNSFEPILDELENGGVLTIDIMEFVKSNQDWKDIFSEYLEVFYTGEDFSENKFIELFDDMVERYECGFNGNPYEFIQQLCENYGWFENLPSFIISAIDYEKMWRDNLSYDYVETNNYLFKNN